MATGIATRRRGVPYGAQGPGLWHGHTPGSLLDLSGCNRWQKPEGRRPVVLIFRGLRSVLRLPGKQSHCPSTVTPSITEWQQNIATKPSIAWKYIYLNWYLYKKWTKVQSNEAAANEAECGLRQFKADTDCFSWKTHIFNSSSCGSSEVVCLP